MCYNIFYQQANDFLLPCIKFVIIDCIIIIFFFFVYHVMSITEQFKFKTNLIERPSMTACGYCFIFEEYCSKKSNV